MAPRTVSLAALNTAFDEGATVNPQALLDKGLVRRQRGKVPQVKVLANGALEKRLQLTGCDASAAARRAIEQAGGTVA